MEHHHSVAGVVRRSDGRVLIMHRFPGGAAGGKWEFPGGKVEDDEEPRDALVREWTEETGLEINAGQVIARGQFSHNSVQFTLTAYEVILSDTDAQPDLREHDAYMWADVDELDGLNMVESDRAVVEMLKEAAIPS